MKQHTPHFCRAHGNAASASSGRRFGANALAKHAPPPYFRA